MAPADFTYQINERLKFDQGDKSYHFRGEGKVLLQQNYPQCNCYLVEMDDGRKVQVVEEHILGKI
ncbi:hypothetical protein KASHIRA_02740 [Serratia phage vB_SmaM-Kashira]|nr:hypothetical protein [Acinetobacter phage ABPH49]URC22848.1 hypothetical protein KASHIRA_02740 [Serratia phage vB_SmaM-Kashira]